MRTPFISITHTVQVTFHAALLSAKPVSNYRPQMCSFVKHLENNLPFEHTAPANYEYFDRVQEVLSTECG